MILPRGKNKVSPLLSPKATFAGQARVSNVIVFICFLLLLTPSVAIALQENLNFSATVPAQPSDFKATMSLTNPSGTTFAQNTTLTYQFTYSNLLSYSSNITVEADWSLGTVQGNSTPSVDILDYVVGSTTNAYNSTSPVVDTVNRKITWTILSFPANTTKTVGFKLKTNSNYTGASTVSFSASGRVLGPGTATGYSTMTKNYQYQSTSPTATPTPTPTSVPGPTNTPGPNPTSTPTPTGIPSPSFEIENISINSISASGATINISLNQPATVRVLYGKTPSSLSEKITVLTASLNQEITLPNLTKNTAYYFTVTATNQNGQRITSDIYTLKTAVSTDIPEINLQSFLATSQDILLYSGASNQKDKQQTIIIPTDNIFSFQFTTEGSTGINRIQAFLRSKNVLGLSSFIQKTEAAGDQSIELIEIKPNQYAGKLSSNLAPGSYDLYVRIYAQNDSVSEEKVSNVRIIKPLYVLEKGNKNPIENARILLSYFNSKLKSYQEISPLILQIKNPSYTESNGEVKVVLPEGKYRASISAIGYKATQVDFVIGIYSGQDFPTIELEKQPFNLLTTTGYYVSTITDVLDVTKLYLKSLAFSNRFFDLTAFTALSLLVFLTLLSFTHRMRISLTSLPHYLRHHFFEHNHNMKLRGRIVDTETDNGIAHTFVSVLDAHSEKVLCVSLTDEKGRFVFEHLSDTHYKLLIIKNDYISSKFSLDVHDENEIVLSITRFGVKRVSLKNFENYLQIFSSFLLEILLFLSFILEIVLGYSLGWTKAIPFIVITFINLLLWIHLLKHRRTS